MPEQEFWSLIARARQTAIAQSPAHGDELLDLQIAAMQQLLTALPAEQIVAYQRRYEEISARLYRWDIWGAAYWLNGGCGDDGFIDFRATVISLGKERVRQTLADPDSLADLVSQKDTPCMQAEGFQYVASRAYSVKTGGGTFPLPDAPVQPEVPVGQQWDFDDEELMAERYPRLVEVLPEMGG